MRRWLVIATVGCGGLAFLAACAETTRYRVLTFFFDGVPEPGAARSDAVRKDAAAEPAGPVAEIRPPVRYYAHTPYRDNRCGGCHDSESGHLVKSLQDGLCLICHAALTRGPAFLHGPVAVNDCTMCHHYHTATQPKLLLTDPDATCLQCHDRTDLSEGAHHATLESTQCVECHDPHGADNRFFLKRIGT